MVRWLARFCSVMLVAAVMAMTASAAVSPLAHAGENGGLHALEGSAHAAGDHDSARHGGTSPAEAALHRHTALGCCLPDAFCSAFDPCLRDGAVAFFRADHSTVTWTEGAPRTVASVVPDVCTPPPKRLG